MSIETNSSVGSTGSTGRTSSQSVVAKSATGGGCFLGDTLVYTENGYKKIKDIKAGDKVYSKDIETDVKELNTVTRVFKNESLYIVHITVNNEEICCTLEHPFWIVNRGWAAAKDIQAGDIIETYYGECAYVSEILIDELTESIEIYNIEVEEARTYYVSELNLLVHNSGCGVSEEGINSNPEKASYSSRNIKNNETKVNESITKKRNNPDSIYKSNSLENPKVAENGTSSVDDVVKASNDGSSSETSHENGKKVFGPYYDEAVKLFKENSDFFPNPDSCTIVQGEELAMMRKKYDSMAASGQLERGHHIKGLAFGGKNVQSNIVHTGESTIRRSKLTLEQQHQYYAQGYTSNPNYKIAKIVENPNGTIIVNGKKYSFGLNNSHTEATNFQNKVLRWQRNKGLRK